MNLRPWLSALALCATMAWGLWLLSHARSKEAYVEQKLAKASTLHWCQWQEPASTQLASLGLDMDGGNAWSDRSTALLALPIQAAPAGAWLDLDFVALAARSMLLQVVGSKKTYLVTRPGRFRLMVPPSRSRSVLMLRMQVVDPMPPKGNEHRWLGAALAQVRVCQR